MANSVVRYTISMSNKESNHKWYVKNAERLKQKQAQWQKENPELRRTQQNRLRWRKMGVSVEQVESARKTQSNCCAICNKSTKLYVDHSHKTNTFRGLLCNHCNVGLGHFFDSVELLQKAVEYLSG